MVQYEDVLNRARETIGPTCKVCPECNGLGCGTRLPGPGCKGPINGANVNFNAWREIQLEMDPFGENIPVNTETEFLEKKLSMPLLCGPAGSLKWEYKPTDNIHDFIECCLAACEASGILHAYGTGLVENIFPAPLDAARRHGSAGFPVFNPVGDGDIMAMLDQCHEGTSPPAFGLVVDSAGLPFLKTLGGSAGSKTVEQVRALKEYSGLPLVIKGVMNANAARKALEAGADAIVVSNHGGRVLSGTPATAHVLPEIAEATEGKAKVIVDGGIRTGGDIFKALALGADLAMVCRPVIISYFGGRQKGIECYLQKLKEELADVMFMCGARKISDIRPHMIRFHPSHS